MTKHLTKHLIHFAKGSILVLGALIPAALSTPAGRSFLSNHPSVAAYMVACGGIATVVYKWAKGNRTS